MGPSIYKFQMAVEETTNYNQETALIVIWKLCPKWFIWNLNRSCNQRNCGFSIICWHFLLPKQKLIWLQLEISYSLRLHFPILLYPSFMHFTWSLPWSRPHVLFTTTLPHARSSVENFSLCRSSSWFSSLSPPQLFLLSWLHFAGRQGVWIIKSSHRESGEVLTERERERDLTYPWAALCLRCRISSTLYFLS